MDLLDIHKSAADSEQANSARVPDFMPLQNVRDKQQQMPTFHQPPNINANR